MKTNYKSLAFLIGIILFMIAGMWLTGCKTDNENSKLLKQKDSLTVVNLKLDIEIKKIKLEYLKEQ